MKVMSLMAGGLLVLAAGTVSAEKLTNDSVIQLVKPGTVTEEVIVSTVATAAEVDFDMSVNGIIALSNAKVPPKVIEAMQKRASLAAVAAQLAPAVAVRDAVVAGVAAQAGDVFLVDGGKTSKLVFSDARREVSGRAVWAVGTRGAFNLVVPGQKAQLRIKNKQPAFLVSLPAAQNPEELVTLVSLGVRKHRYLAWVGISGQPSAGLRRGISADRLVGISIEKAADQSGAAAGRVLYTVKPNAPLLSTAQKSRTEFGEYALNIGNDNQFFDFGVDE